MNAPPGHELSDPPYLLTGTTPVFTRLQFSHTRPLRCVLTFIFCTIYENSLIKLPEAMILDFSHTLMLLYHFGRLPCENWSRVKTGVVPVQVHAAIAAATGGVQQPGSGESAASINRVRH